MMIMRMMAGHLPLVRSVDSLGNFVQCRQTLWCSSCCKTLRTFPISHQAALPENTIRKKATNSIKREVQKILHNKPISSGLCDTQFHDTTACSRHTHYTHLHNSSFGGVYCDHGGTVQHKCYLVVWVVCHSQLLHTRTKIGTIVVAVRL